jgi:uncharacterized protein (DUF1499 family)
MALLGLPLAMLAGLIMVVAALGNRTQFLPIVVTLPLLGLGLLGAIVSTLVSLTRLIFTLARQSPNAHLAPHALVLALGFILLAIPGCVIYAALASGAPRIHDVTTDTEDVPQFVDVLPRRVKALNPTEYGGPAVAAQQRRAFPDVRTVVLHESPDEAFDRALAAVREMGWELVSANRAAGRIEATATTFWFGFKDDVVVRVKADSEGSRIDIRSLSRVGAGDAGTNARRIRTYTQRLSDRC